MAVKAGPVLSLKAWRGKHAVKLSGLKESEIKQRYRQYVLSKNNRIYNRGVVKEDRITMAPKISKCAVDYLKALVDPFGPFDQLPCIPDVLTLPSYKFKTLTRAPIATGVDSCGYIAMNTFAIASDQNIAQGTTSNFTGTAYDTGQVPANYSLLTSNSPFTIATANPGTNTRPFFRLVGAGVRVRYTGPLIAQGGTFTLYRAPGNNQIPTPTTQATMQLNDRTARVPVTNDWSYVTYQPTDNDSLSYRQYGQLPAGHNILIFINGTGQGLPFDVELVQYWECQSTSIGQTTHSHSDPVGMGAVLASLPARGSGNKPSTDVVPTLAKAGQEIMRSTSTIVPLLKDAGAAFSGLVGGFLGGPVGGAAGSALGKLLMSGPSAREIISMPLALGNGPTVEDVSDY
jgi:hypothetical protein